MKGYEMTEMRRAQNPWDNARETPLFQIMKLHLYKEFRLILIWIFGWISGVPKILRSGNALGFLKSPFRVIPEFRHFSVSFGFDGLLCDLGRLHQQAGGSGLSHRFPVRFRIALTAAEFRRQRGSSRAEGHVRCTVFASRP